MTDDMADMKGPFQRLLGRLARPFSSNGLVREVEGLRFIAISTVFLYHLHGYLKVKSSASWMAGRESFWDQLFHVGGYGVQLFFVISGFVLALPFASHALKQGPAIGLKRYYLRRLTRLEPPYLASLLLCLAGLWLVNRQSLAELWPHFLASSVYLHAAVYHCMSVINPVTWSLEIEVQFYLLAPLLAKVFLLRHAPSRRALQVLLLLLLLFLQSMFELGDNRSNGSLLNYLQYFMIGFLLADLFLLNPPAAREPNWRWDLVSALGWPLLILALGKGLAVGWLLPAGLFLLIYAALYGRYFPRFFRASVPVTLGGMCYSIYLLHLTGISAVARFTKDFEMGGNFLFNFMAQLLVVGIAVLIPCTLFFAFIEKPCMDRSWPRRLKEACFPGLPNRQGAAYGPE